MADSRGVDRRTFLRGAGVAGAVGATAVGARALAAGTPAPAAPTAVPAGPARAGAHATHGSAAGLTVPKRPRKGDFDPHTFLRHFDGGSVSRDSAGRTVREYHFQVEEKRIEIADGIFFDAWTYNGAVPGPTIRATVGDRIRITFHNTSAMPHSIHFHGVHESLQDGVPGANEAGPGETVVYDFIAGRLGHNRHLHRS